MVDSVTAPVKLRVVFENPQVIRALDDLHKQFEATAELIARVYNGPSKDADRGIALIEQYGLAVERVVGTMKS